MSYSLNKKLCDLVPYEPVKGEFEIRLDANESYYNINDDLSEKISEGISSLKLNRYPDPYAQKAVKAFSDYYEINEKYVTAGNGSDELISVITSCFLEKGDKIVTIKPDFSMYAFYGSLYELETLEFSSQKDLSINVDKLIDFCKINEPKMLIFSNPCNPSSLGIARKEMFKILDYVNCLVVLDEAYMDFWDESVLDKIDKYDNLIILKTCSKAIGLAGVRFGFAVAGDTITTALKAAKSPYNTDSVSQKMIEVVFGEKEFLTQKRKEIIENKNNLLKEIISLSEKYTALEIVYPSNTNFVFIKTNFAEEIFQALLKNSIAIRKFDGYLRINTGSESENKKLLEVLESILKNLK